MTVVHSEHARVEALPRSDTTLGVIHVERTMVIR